MRFSNEVPRAGKWATGVVLSLAFSLSPAWGAAAFPELKPAHQQEVNDAARYAAYARQADSEGMGEAGSLFRAVARSESIHGQIHATLLRSLGDTAVPVPEPVSAGTTDENLRAAIELENRERHRNYPALVHRAKQAGTRKTAEAMTRIQNAEGQHEILFNQVQSRARMLKTSERRFFYVCPDCGYVTDEITFEQCPGCLGNEARFEMVD